MSGSRAPHIYQKFNVMILYDYNVLYNVLSNDSFLFLFTSLGSAVFKIPFPCPKQISPSPPPNIYAFKVLYPYDAQLPDELTIRPGDVITVEEGDNEEDSLWWKGTNEDEDKGYFYWNFTEKTYPPCRTLNLRALGTRYFKCHNALVPMS